MSVATYDLEWFRKRAFSSLRKIKDGYWDYSDSLLLYLPSEVDLYESLQNTNSPYHTLITKPEREYLSSIAMDVAKKLPDNFEFIDLGPGTEHKEQFLFDALATLGKKFTYIPVDISERYIKLAETHAAKQGISVRPIQSSFEELSEKISDDTTPRFVSIGLTFSNYAPQEVLKMLKNIAGKNGFIFINAHIKDRTDIIELQKVYSLDAVHMADDKLKIVGLDPDKDVSRAETSADVKVWFTITNSNPDIEKIGIKKDDKLLVFQSLRYTKDSLVEELEKIKLPYTTFDNGSAFIATLIQPR